MFRLMKLKPPHGWSAVAWELAIVTVGVILALAAQQAAETVNERREVAETRATLTNEIKETLAVLELRKAAQPCIDNRLKELRAIVDQWGRTGGFKTPRWVSQATWFALNTARFDAAESAGTLALLPDEEQYRMGLIVASLRNFRGIQLDEMQAWAQLRMLQSGSDALSPSDRTAVRAALQEASLLNYRAKVVVGQTLMSAAGYGWRSDRSRVQRLMTQAWEDGKFRPSVCVSIDTPADEANRKAKMLYPVAE